MNCYFADKEIVALRAWWESAYGCDHEDEVIRSITRKLDRYAGLVVSNEQQRRWREAERLERQYG